MALYIPKDRHSLFRQFLSGMYDAVLITDPMGHLIEVNSRAEEYFKIVNEEVADKPISQFVAGLTVELVQRIRKGLEDNRHMVIDGNGIRSDLTRFPCEVMVSSVDLNEKNDLVFVIRNTERRKAVMTSLRAKAGAFRLSQAALFVCDFDGKFVDVNDAFVDLFDFSNELDAQKSEFTQIFDDRPLIENFKKALQGEKTITEITAKTEDASEKVEVVLAPNREGRKILGVIGSVIKVS
ncbi:MAG: PAS domain S-box protein [Kiritimatiellae bacterium]|nr:PAS domain S-box protein [Kiritimatiellia bacterium]